MVVDEFRLFSQNSLLQSEKKNIEKPRILIVYCYFVLVIIRGAKMLYYCHTFAIDITIIAINITASAPCKLIIHTSANLRTKILMEKPHYTRISNLTFYSAKCRLFSGKNLCRHHYRSS